MSSLLGRQESAMGAETGGWKFAEDQNMGVTSEFLSTKCYLNAKGKMETRQWRNLADALLSGEIKVKVTGVGQVNIVESPCDEKASHPFHSFPPRRCGLSLDVGNVNRLRLKVTEQEPL